MSAPSSPEGPGSVSGAPNLPEGFADTSQYVDTGEVRSMAERAGATITEEEGSPVIMVSRPGAVAEVKMSAVASVDRATAGVAR